MYSLGILGRPPSVSAASLRLLTLLVPCARHRASPRRGTSGGEVRDNLVQELEACGDGRVSVLLSLSWGPRTETAEERRTESASDEDEEDNGEPPRDGLLV